MKRVLILLIVIVLGSVSMVHAQAIRVSGVVTSSEDKLPIPGVNVYLKENPTVGTTTDINGRYNLAVPQQGKTIVFKLIGFSTQEIIADKATISIVLSPQTEHLDEVVVTALGISREKKSLSYSAQSVNNQEISTVKDANFTNALAGKASNVNIVEGSGGAGSATKIVLRGNNSINGTGSPLIVIDGMPVTNENPRTATGQGVFGGTYLSADGLSSVNPDNIENIVVLKGPSAAALYGSQASNGAILITTKSGKAGVSKVELSTNTTFSAPAYYPESQTEYGSNDASGVGSWGGKVGNSRGTAKLLKDFLQTGLNTSNAVSFTSGNDAARVYVGYANTYSKGLVPKNTLNRQNFDVKGNANFLDKFIEVEAKVSYMNQDQRNPFSPGYYFNPMAIFTTMGSNFPLEKYKDYFNPTGGFNYVEGVGGQNWSSNPQTNDPTWENPYWIINKIKVKNTQDRLLSSANLKFNLTDYLNLQLRGTMDKMDDNYDQRFYVGTNTTVGGVNGQQQLSDRSTKQYYGDALLNFNKTFIDEKLGVNALLGGSIRDYTTTGKFIDAKQQMYFPDFYDVSNFNFLRGAYINPIYDRKQLQSVFYSVEFSILNSIFLTHTGRNDWSSTLPKDKNSYFYPSVGTSVVLTELFPGIKSQTLGYLKARVSYTRVGNDLPSFIINPVFTVSSTGGAQQAKTVVEPNTVIKPELTASIEAGIDFSMFNNLIRFEGTYYKTNTTNQLFTVAAPQSSGYENYYVNGGNIQNKGYELSLSLNKRFGDLSWISTLNFSQNFNEVISLSNNEPIRVTDQAPEFVSLIKEGGRVGDMYAQKIVKGSMNNSGLPDIESDVYIGNANPDALASWSNSFDYKGIRLSFLVDARLGGKVLSFTQSEMDFYGNSKQSAIDRDRGYVEAYGMKYQNVKGFYGLVAGRGGAWGEYAYDASVVKMRELSIAYSIPQQLLGKTKYVKGVTLSLIGRNLFYFYRPAPVDANISSTTNSNQFSGIELLNLPASRSLGFGVNIVF